MWLNARPRDNATLSNVVANLWPAGHMRSLVTVQSGIIPTKMLAIKAQVTTHTKNKKMQTPKSCGFICLFACSFVCLFTYKLTNPAHRLSINVAFRPDIPVCLGFTPLLKSRLQYCVKSLTQTTLFFFSFLRFVYHSLNPKRGFFGTCLATPQIFSINFSPFGRQRSSHSLIGWTCCWPGSKRTAPTQSMACCEPPVGLLPSLRRRIQGP